MIGPDPVGPATGRLPTVDGDRGGSDPIDSCAKRAEEVGEVLHVWLAGGVAKDGGSARRRRRNKGVLRRGDAGLIEKDVSANERLRAELELVVGGDVGAEPLERQEMR